MNALDRLQRTIDRRCDNYDFPRNVARRKALRLYYMLARRNPGIVSFQRKAIQLQRCHRLAAGFFEPVTRADMAR